MLREAPVLAGVTKTATGNIEPTGPGRDGRANKNHDERSKDRQSAPIEKTKNQCESAQHFQPREKKCQSHAEEPGQYFIVVDVQSELDRIKDFEHTSVNKQAPNDYIHNSPCESWMS